MRLTIGPKGESVKLAKEMSEEGLLRQIESTFENGGALRLQVDIGQGELGTVVLNGRAVNFVLLVSSDT